MANTSLPNLDEYNVNVTPYLNTGSAKDLITQGKQADLIQGSLENIIRSELNCYAR